MSTREYSDEQVKKMKQWAELRMACFILFIIVGVIGGGMYGCPQYSVYQKALAGKAELEQAEYNRKIKVREAEASKDSATFFAEAEIIRANGVAEANKVIGESLKKNEAYLRYLWIQGLHDGSSEIIYVPTEANLPILEATRGVKR